MFKTLRKGIQAARSVPMLFLLVGLLSMMLSLTALPGSSQAALLDFGPIVPEVVGSTPPNIQAGFPLWFRDTNRVPLQLCLEEVPGCLFAAVDRPDLGLPLAFPNIPDELFYYSATALIPNADPLLNDHLLFAGVEMNFADNGDGTYEQVGFSRVRIRIDSTIAGDYTVTTPWKQYVFTVDQATIDATAGRRVINATEDIGLGPDGQFAGVLLGNVGPYGYSQGAPFVTPQGSFLGDNTPRTIVGTPNNIFRIEGPPGFATVETDQFAVTGKLYDLAPIPTPLTVDRVTYSRNASGLQVNAFATTQPLSNQTVPTAPFPQNYALTGALSALQLAGTDIPTLDMTTNSPEDGKFFVSTGTIADPGTIPNTVNLTNTADVPPTVVSPDLVDEVVISSAVFTPSTRTLNVAAVSGDAVTPPTLQLFFPGETDPAGTLANGQISIGFPITIGAKTYEVPTATISVVSSLGGSETKFVSVPLPTPAPIAVDDAASTIVNATISISVLANDTGDIDPTTVVPSVPTGGTASANPDGTVTFTAPAAEGSYTFTYTVSGTGGTSNSATVTVTVGPPAAVASVTLTPGVAAPQSAGTPVTFVAVANGGTGSYEYKFWLNDGATWTMVQDYSTTPFWTWNTTGLAAGGYTIGVDARNAGSAVPRDTFAFAGYTLGTPAPTPFTGVTITPSAASPAAPPVDFQAVGTGGSGTPEYNFWLYNATSATWSEVQPYSTNDTWQLPIGTAAGDYIIAVNVRNQGTPVNFDAVSYLAFTAL